MLTNSPTTRTFQAIILQTTILVIAVSFNFVSDAKEEATKPKQKSTIQEVGKLPVEIISESSGLIAVSNADDVFWTMNDSGGKATLYAVNSKGKLLKSVEISKAKNVDWEALARDEKGNIFIGDVGKSRGRRETYTIYSLKEPKLKGESKIESIKTIEFQFPNKEKGVDIEAMVVASGKAYLFSKELLRTRVFTVDLVEKKKTVEAKLFTEASGKILLTGADLDSSRRRLALLSYTGLMIFEFPKPWEELKAEQIKKALSKPRKHHAFFYGQVEAIAWHGKDLFFTSEKGPIWKIDSALPPQKP